MDQEYLFGGAEVVYTGVLVVLSLFDYIYSHNSHKQSPIAHDPSHFQFTTLTTCSHS